MLEGGRSSSMSTQKDRLDTQDSCKEMREQSTEVLITILYIIPQYPTFSPD